jgi:hypothetical protein
MPFSDPKYTKITTMRSMLFSGNTVFSHKIVKCIGACACCYVHMLNVLMTLAGVFSMLNVLVMISLMLCIFIICFGDDLLSF